MTPGDLVLGLMLLDPGDDAAIRELLAQSEQGASTAAMESVCIEHGEGGYADIDALLRTFHFMKGVVAVLELNAATTHAHDGSIPFAIVEAAKAGASAAGAASP